MSNMLEYEMKEYKYLVVPVVTLIVAQILKFTIESIRIKN